MVEKLHILDNKVKHNDYFSKQEVLINIYDYLQERLSNEYIINRVIKERL